MKSIKQDIKQKSYEAGVNASIVAEAVQTDIAIKYAEILTKQTQVKASSVEEAFLQMEKNTMDLYSTALASFSDIQKDINVSSSKIFQQSVKEAKQLVKLDSDDEIKKYLFRITGNQLLSNQKIAYKNGRKIGYKEYVEIATRTRMQHQLLEQEQEFGLMTAQLFYVCDTYSDCANDHQEYQGKLYYSQKVLDGLNRNNPHMASIMSGVRKCKGSIEKVTTEAPYLCTRPNCRHRLIPIAIDDVIDKTNHQILKEQKADKGNYSTSTLKKNYDDTQKQRKIELAIRTAKRNAEILENYYQKSKDAQVLNRLNNARASIRLGQANMRKLMSSNKSLKRDYRRENPYHLQKDLGVAYNSVKVRARVDVPKSEISDIVDWDKKINKSFDEYKSTIDYIDKSNSFSRQLSPKESKYINHYTGREYALMNRVMYDKDGLYKSLENNMESRDMIIRRSTDLADGLHNVFKKLRDANIKGDKAFVTYRGGVNIIKEDDTTIIFNGFTSSSVSLDTAKFFLKNGISKSLQGESPDVAMYKIIIPPASHNQTLYYGGMEEDEFIIDTNSVYDIIGEETISVEYSSKGDTKDVKQYTLLLRPKHKGVQR